MRPGAFGLLLLARAADPAGELEALLARGLVPVERREVVNPYAGIRREELLLEGGGERWLCLRWGDGTSRCACAAGPGS